MTAARLLATALALTVGAVTALSGAAAPPANARAAAADPGSTPLSVHIDSLNRATLPQHGRLVVTGTVTNDSEERWRDINVQPLTSHDPLTTRQELDSAAATPADTYIGDRLTAPKTFVTIGDLAPGAAAGFRLSLPARAFDISGAPGVYWFGIHALGTNAEGHDQYADGRARTFLPLVPRRTTPTTAALVVPLRATVRRGPDGALLDMANWTATLAAGGVLERELSFVEQAQGVPLTWLVDPAVLQAADDVAHGNPTLSYGEPTGASGSPSSSASPSAIPSGASASPGAPTPAPGTPTGPPPTPSTPENLDKGLPVTDKAALDWLQRARTAMAGARVLTLPYADPDVATLTHRDASLLRAARGLARRTQASLGIQGAPAVAPVDGVLRRASLPDLRRGTTVLLSDRGRGLHRTHWRTGAQQDLFFTDARASSGGPSPTPPLDALALRQRIVADAALQALHHVAGPMVVTLPSGWDPGAAWQKAGFFRGLESLPWLQLTSLSTDPVAPKFHQRLPYPHSAVRHRIHVRNVEAAHRLVTAGRTLAGVLATDNQVADRVTGAALTGVSYHARTSPATARHRVEALDATIRHSLSQIQVSGTDFVTLSGGSGTITVALVNDLEVPVTVDLRARSDSSQVHIRSSGPVEVGAGQRSTVRLATSSSAVGVHQIRLTPVSASGRPVGSPLVFSLRTSDVGQWIWVVLAAGGLLLVVAIVRRVVRRVGAERRR